MQNPVPCVNEPIVAYLTREWQNIQHSSFVRYKSKRSPHMGENKESTGDFAIPTSYENNKLVNNLSVKNMHNNEIDSTDAIECSSRYVSSNVDK